MILKFEFLEKPIGKERPRMFLTRSRTICYTPKNTKEYEKRLSKYVKQIMKDKKLEIINKNTAVAVYINAYFKRPKNTAIINTFPLITPDIDNISKIILDALNGVVYKDDSQVAYLNVEKLYSETPRILVTISTIYKNLS